MRPALLGVVVLVVAAAAIQPGSAAQARTRQVARAESAVFWTPRAGLVAIDYCAPGSQVCSRGAVERTADGGRTFHVVRPTNGPIIGIKTIGSRGAIATLASGEAWRTLDGGRTWRQTEFKPYYWATPRIALRFDAYYRRSSQKLALRVTHDGGKTWRILDDPCNRTVTYNAYADLVTPKLWWIVCVGLPAGGTMEKAVFRTRDGGRTWRAGAANLTLPGGPVQRGIAFNGYPNGLAFAKNGFGLLTESQGTLFVSRDGGRHFSSRPRVHRPNVDFARGAAAFSGGVGYVLLTAGFPARLVATRDFGRTWRVVRRWSG